MIYKKPKVVFRLSNQCALWNFKLSSIPTNEPMEVCKEDWIDIEIKPDLWTFVRFNMKSLGASRVFLGRLSLDLEIIN